MSQYLICDFLIFSGGCFQISLHTQGVSNDFRKSNSMDLHQKI